MVDAFENRVVVTTSDGKDAIGLTAMSPSVTVVGDPIDVTVDELGEVAASGVKPANGALPMAVAAEDKG